MIAEYLTKLFGIGSPVTVRNQLDIVIIPADILPLLFRRGWKLNPENILDYHVRDQLARPAIPGFGLWPTPVLRISIYEN